MLLLGVFIDLPANVQRIFECHCVLIRLATFKEKLAKTKIHCFSYELTWLLTSWACVDEGLCVKMLFNMHKNTLH